MNPLKSFSSPQTPWQLSPEATARLTPPDRDQKRVTLQPNDPEFQSIQQLFAAHKPPGSGIELGREAKGQLPEDTEGYYCSQLLQAKKMSCTKSRSFI